MLMLSEIQRFNLVDNQNQTARIADLSVDLLKEDHPPIKQILFWNNDRKLVGLDWKNCGQIDIRKKRIQVANLNEAQEFSDENLTHEVLLVRDVLDALVLDLQNRRATRANDLWLEKNGEQLVLSRADISATAIFRRLSFNLWRRIDRKNLFDWRFIEFLRGDPEAVRNGAGYNLRITKLAPGEIAGFIDLIPYLHAAELIILLPDQLAVDVLELTSPDKQLQIFEELDDEQTRKMFTMLAPDTAAKIIKQLKEETARKVLRELPKDAAAKILELLRFPEGTVGSMMTNDIVFLPLDLTVDQARQFLTEPLKKPNFVYFVYVVETLTSRVLRGVISLRRIVTAEPDEKIVDIMDEFVSVLSPLDDCHAASFRLIDSHLAAMPIVDETNKLLGVLTIDAAVSNVAPPSWRDQAPRVFS